MAGNLVDSDCLRGVATWFWTADALPSCACFALAARVVGVRGCCLIVEGVVGEVVQGGIIYKTVDYFIKGSICA
jgi:hypothetical protein